MDAKRQWAKKQKLKFLPRVHNIAPFFTGDEAEVTIPLKSITGFLQDLKAIKQMRIIKGFKKVKKIRVCLCFSSPPHYDGHF